jgi:hypothetical protein
MNKHEIPDDMKDLLLTEEERKALMKASKGATRRKSRAPKTRFKFTIFPDEWEYQLARVQAEGGVYRVALYLLRETWRAGSNRVKLANEVLKARGVSRWQKYHALDVLGSLGLISTERGSRKSPVVTVKFTD